MTTPRRLQPGRVAIVQRLKHACSEQLAVSVHRKLGLPGLRGFVVGVGRRWVAVALVDDREMLDGWGLVRLNTIVAVTVNRDPQSFEVRALNARSLWPPTSPDIVLDRSMEVMKSAGAAYQVISVSVRSSEGLLVGSVRAVDEGNLVLRTIDRQGRWQSESRRVRIRDVVRVDIGDAYAQALMLVANSESAKEVTIRDRLQEAQRLNALVKLKRRVPGTDTIEGFVCGIGGEWVAVAKLSEALFHDGWMFVRLADIRKVRLVRTVAEQSLEAKVLQVRSEWPPVAPAVDLDDVVGPLRAVLHLQEVATVYLERAYPDMCWVGLVRSLSGGLLTLQAIDPRAEWESRPRLYDFEDITRVDLGGRYEDTLRATAEPMSPSWNKIL